MQTNVLNSSTKEEEYSNLNLPNSTELSKERITNLSQTFKLSLNGGKSLHKNFLDRYFRRTNLNQDQKIVLALTQRLGSKMINASNEKKLTLFKTDAITTEGFKSVISSKENNKEVKSIIAEVKNGDYPLKQLQAIANLRTVIEPEFRSLGGSAEMARSVSPAMIPLSKIKKTRGNTPKIEAARNFIASRALEVVNASNDVLGPENWSGISLRDISQYSSHIMQDASATKIRELGNELLKYQQKDLLEIRELKLPK